MAVNKAIGCNLAPYQGDATDYFCRFLSVEFSLRHNNFHFESQHELGGHQFQIEARVASPDNELLAIQPEIMVIVPFVLHARMGVTSGILTFETDIVARFETRDGQWFDAVSNVPIERVADYMAKFMHS